MGRINEAFQRFLEQKNFRLKAIEQETEWVYRGRLQLTEYHIVDFSVTMQKEEESAIYQIVYNNVAFCKRREELAKWLQVINEINQYSAGIYYFCIDENGQVFARHIGRVSQDFDDLYLMIASGGMIISQTVKELEDRLQVSVHF